MCGLAGILKKTGPLDSEIKPILRTMGNQIAYRGPDDEQIFTNGAFGAVFRRLSIVDLAGGRQPLFNEDNSLVLMVNGEIYNHQELKARLKESHQFRTQSDCEILLHLYEEQGEGFLNEVNGMFALALWDKNQQRLLLARDRLGIKPLYYTDSKQRLLFGSEIKALLAYPDCPREFDWLEALSYQSLSYQPQWMSPNNSLPSFFKDLHYLPAGGLLIAELPTYQITVKRYWTLTPLSEEDYASDTRSEQEIIDGYGELLADAVKLCLMADVEVGLFLSGGIDSVSVAALASRYQQLHTFSVLSQSTFQNGDAKAGHSAAKYLGLPNHQVLYSWHDNPFTPEHWKALLWLCETPLCNAEHLYKYHLHRYAKQSRPALKVILLGQGSDEFNGGYSTYYVKNHRPDLSEAERNWSAFIMGIASDLEKDALIARANAGLAQYGGVLTKAFLASCRQQTPFRHPWLYYVNLHLQSLQLYNLWHEDRTAAGNSIENRVPFLDHRLVEYALRIPPKHYETLFWDKRILRRAMQPHLPLELSERPKGPFFYGEDVRYTRRMIYNLLVADDSALIREAFEENSDVFDQPALDKLITSIPEDPEYNLLESLLPLVNMGLLAKMAQTPVSQSHPHADSVEWLSEVAIDNWEAQADNLALQLAIRREQAELDQTLAFTPGTRLLKVDHASEGSECSYIVMDDQIEYELPEVEMKEWLAVLRRIDGERSLNEILAELDIPAAKIRKHLEEALDYGIVSLVEE